MSRDRASIWQVSLSQIISQVTEEFISHWKTFSQTMTVLAN
jgi:hypothetical protein